MKNTRRVFEQRITDRSRPSCRVLAKQTKSCASITSLCLLFFAEIKKIKIEITNVVGIINCGEKEYISVLFFLLFCIP